MHKKGLNFAPVGELAKLNFSYTYHSTEIVKAGPGFDDQLEHPPVQINSSSPWILLIIKDSPVKTVNEGFESSDLRIVQE